MRILGSIAAAVILAAVGAAGSLLLRPSRPALLAYAQDLVPDSATITETSTNEGHPLIVGAPVVTVSFRYGLTSPPSLRQELDRLETEGEVGEVTTHRGGTSITVSHDAFTALVIRLVDSEGSVRVEQGAASRRRNAALGAATGIILALTVTRIRWLKVADQKLPPGPSTQR